MEDKLTYAPKNGYDRLSKEDRAAIDGYCRRYMNFMDAAKTEREAIIETVKLAESAGFKNINNIKKNTL